MFFFLFQSHFDLIHGYQPPSLLSILTATQAVCTYNSLRVGFEPGLAAVQTLIVRKSYFLPSWLIKL